MRSFIGLFHLNWSAALSPLNTGCGVCLFPKEMCAYSLQMSLLRVKKEEVIAIGDGNNDKSLLLSSGLRIAMGNAVQELKDIAHYIAPDVKHDGVAYVIEKFVLKKH